MRRGKILQPESMLESKKSTHQYRDWKTSWLGLFPWKLSPTQWRGFSIIRQQLSRRRRPSQPFCDHKRRLWVHWKGSTSSQQRRRSIVSVYREWHNSWSRLDSLEIRHSRQSMPWVRVSQRRQNLEKTWPSSCRVSHSPSDRFRRRVNFRLRNFCSWPKGISQQWTSWKRNWTFHKRRLRTSEMQGSNPTSQSRLSSRDSMKDFEEILRNNLRRSEVFSQTLSTQLKGVSRRSERERQTQSKALSFL